MDVSMSSRSSRCSDSKQSSPRPWSSSTEQEVRPPRNSRRPTCNASLCADPRWDTQTYVYYIFLTFRVTREGNRERGREGEAHERANAEEKSAVDMKRGGRDRVRGNGHGEGRKRFVLDQRRFSRSARRPSPPGRGSKSSSVSTPKFSKFLQNFTKFYFFFWKVLSLKILQNCTKFYIFLKSSELGSVDVGSVELNSNPWIRKDLFAR